MENNRLVKYTLIFNVGLFLLVLGKLIFLSRNLILRHGETVEFDFFLVEIRQNCRYQAENQFDFVWPNCENFPLGEEYTILGKVVGVIDNQVQYAKNLDVKHVYPKQAKNQSLKLHWQSYVYHFQQLVGGVRQKLITLVEMNFLPKNAQFALALSLGNRAVELDYELKEAVREVGLSHMMAVSGFHLGVVSLVLSVILAGFFRRKLATFFLVMTLLAYIVLVGSPLSMLRAGFMLIFSLIGRCFFYKQVNQVFNLFTCFVFMSLLAVLNVYDVGFQLSFLATGGIIILNRDFASLEAMMHNQRQPEKNKASKGIKRWALTGWKAFKGLILTSVAAQLATLPVLISVFGEYSTWSILSTLVFSGMITLIVTWMSVILLLLLFFGRGAIFELLVAPYIWVMDQMLSYFVRLFDKYSEIFGATFTVDFRFEWWMFGLYFGLLAFFSYFIRKKQQRKYVYI